MCLVDLESCSEPYDLRCVDFHPAISLVYEWGYALRCKQVYLYTSALCAIISDCSSCAVYKYEPHFLYAEYVTRTTTEQEDA